VWDSKLAQIGSFVGYMEDVDTDKEGVGWEKILRVKICVDLTKPLLRGEVAKSTRSFYVDSILI
jgi:hypothetical protein